jgi:hypothetical protein
MCAVVCGGVGNDVVEVGEERTLVSLNRKNLFFPGKPRPHCGASLEDDLKGVVGCGELESDLKAVVGRGELENDFKGVVGRGELEIDLEGVFDRGDLETDLEN